MEYNIHEPWKTLDQWQKEYIKSTDTNCFLLCGRQSGKTTAASIKFGEIAVNQPNGVKEIILMIAETEKQAYNLFFKTLMYLEAKHPKSIKRGLVKPTKHIINLKNGSIIMCYAAGITGSGLRTFTLTRLVIDEAAPMAREIFVATMPMLSVTGGICDMMSTPRGKQGYFYETSLDPTYKKFYVSAEDCPRHSKEFLAAQKLRMTELEYAQEYLAMFLDELRRVYSDEWIKDVCTLKRRKEFRKGRYYGGSDIAGLGKDETTYEIFDKLKSDNIEHVENIIHKKNLTVDTSKFIINLNNTFNFKQYGVDDSGGGGGFGVFSELMNDRKMKYKTIGLNNANRDLNEDGSKKTRLLKVDMYLTMLSEGEHGRLKLLDDDEIIQSLKSIQYTIEDGKLTIFGYYSHITEGLIRGVWLATKDKSLKVFVRCF